MENLNLENFWNPLKEQYPLAVEAFCKWIDEYKKEVGWNKLFNEVQGGSGYSADAPKFHDIPYEMQEGIISRFRVETFGTGARSAKYLADCKWALTMDLIALENILSNG